MGIAQSGLEFCKEVRILPLARGLRYQASMLKRLLPFFLASLAVACVVQKQAPDTSSEADETEAADDDDDDAPKTKAKKTDAGTKTDTAPAPTATDAGPAAPALTTWTANISETAQAIWGAKQKIADGTTVPCFAVVFDDAKLIVKTDAAGNVAAVKFDAALAELSDKRCTGTTPPDAPASYSFDGPATTTKVTAAGAATNVPQSSFNGEFKKIGDSSAIFSTDIERTDAPAPDAWKMHLEIILTKAAP